MMKYVVMAGLGYYLYNQLQQKYNAAMADRNALLAMLTPDQRAQLLQGVQTMQNAATAVVQGAQQAIASASAAAPAPVPLH